MPPLKLKKKKKNGGGGSSLLNHMRSRRTTFHLVSPALRSSLVTLTSPKLTSTAVNNFTARASTPLEIASDAEGKHKMEIKREEQQTTTGEDEEEEWAGCVFEGDDDTPPIARQSELPTLKSLGAHPATPMDDQVPTTQPEKNVVKVKQEVGEGEDEANSEDEAEDGSEDGG